MKQLKAYEYIPSSPVKAAITLLQGYGSNGADLFSLRDYVTQSLGDDVAVIAFDAPFECEMGMGADYRQWFSLQDYAMETMEKGASIAHQYLQIAIESYLDKLNILPQNLILAGFSQGCMMSLYTALRLNTAIGGVVGWSGLLIDDGRLKDEVTAKPNIQLWHGAQDSVVPPSSLKMAKDKLESLSISVEAHMIPHCEHTISPEALNGALLFMKNALDKS